MEETIHHRTNFQSEGWFRKHLSRSHKVNRVSHWIANKQLDNRKKESIITGAIKLQTNELMELVKELTKSICKERSGSDRKLIKFVIRNLRLQFQHKEFVDLVSKFLQYRYYPKDTLIVKQGTPFSHLYLLLEGKCEIVSSGTTMNVSGQAVFGQKDLFQGSDSQVTIRCRSPCQFLVLDSEIFIKEKEKLHSSSCRQIRSILSKIPLFKYFNNEDLREISQESQIIRLEQRGQIVTQGRRHQYFYILAAGELVATELVDTHRKIIVKLERLEVVNFQGLIGKMSVFNVQNQSQVTQLYRFRISNLHRVFAEASKTFKQHVVSNIDSYKSLSANKGKVSNSGRHTNPSQFSNTFISQIDNNLQLLQLQEVEYQMPRVKTSLFSNLRAKSNSLTNRSGSIRSKRTLPVELANIYSQMSFDNARKSHFMLEAFKAKIQNVCSMQLDVINRLYSTKPMDVRRQQMAAKSFRAAKSERGRELTHQTNRSQAISRKQSEVKRHDTEVLLRRVQMSSCRKRRNRTKAMFDPQDILDFSENML